MVQRKGYMLFAAAESIGGTRPTLFYRRQARHWKSKKGEQILHFLLFWIIMIFETGECHATAQ